MTNPTNLWMECKFRFDSSEKIMGHSKLITVCIFLMILIACAESRLRCYNCTYVEYKKKETWAGLEECQAKKFDDEKIPVITCDGTCVTRSVWGDVVVTQRTCHQSNSGPCNRIDRYNIGQDGYLSQVCCRGSRCNHKGNDNAGHPHISAKTLFVIETMALLCFVMFGPVDIWTNGQTYSWRIP
ncbi:uncharacterized protein LOC110987343 isoform X1 [Acanthaster planci]|uniref:Uncharacterized protein LOC110987343 isoform X1 n=1 Tax=Acanthaster planci TaxID=133434 RepID=A0A8B7ZLC2_ACAPL|nr:uncharacterized protein LOC110987343 isoform X1 [Acanthaster planci]